MSVTTVPIQPIKKGSIAKYWIGVSAVILAGAGLAWWGTSGVRVDHASDDQFFNSNADVDGVVTTKSGLQIQTVKGGEGPSPTQDDVVLVGYKGTLRDGTVFDENPQAPMEVGGVVPGFSEALQKMQRGGKYKIWIPGRLGYGENPPPQSKLTPNATLIFDVELLDFKSRAEVQAMQKEAEAMQKEQGGGQPGGGQVGAGPAGAQQGLPPELQAQLEAQLRQQGGQ
jgi:FKBP-type peptidyl-prolyl cis-trans isomerase FkpA